MYESLRPSVTLSEAAWACLDEFRSASYAFGYGLLIADNPELTRENLSQFASDTEGEYVRYVRGNYTLTFSIDPRTILAYREAIHAFASFGASLRMLGAYERYVKRVAGEAYRCIGDQMGAFARKHKKYLGGRGPEENFMHFKLGRGLDLLGEVFGFPRARELRSSLQYFYELRNVAVHNHSLATQELCDVWNAMPFAKSIVRRPGDVVQLGVDETMLLHDLLRTIVTEADPLVREVLDWPGNERQAYWYPATESQSGPQGPQVSGP